MKRVFIKAKNGENVLFFSSKDEAAKHFSVPISRVIEALNASINSSNNEINNIAAQKSTINGYALSRTCSIKPVLQYSLNGKLLAEYDSIVKAEAALKRYGLSKPINSRNRVWKGYYWVFKGHNFIAECRDVVCIDMYGAIIGKYKSIQKASEDTCIEPLQIFASMYNNNRVDGLYFVDAENAKMQIIEIDTEKAIILNIYPKLNIACSASNMKASQIYYSCENEKAVKGRLYYKLSKYISTNEP